MRARWSHVAVALAVIAATAIAAPAIGGPNATTAVKKKALTKLIRKEVSRQIASATGPPGANGLNGSAGAVGANGTARAYARVLANCSPGCVFSHAKGITGVERIGTGDYCITAPGISPASVAAAATVDRNGTSDPEGNASAMIDTFGCSGGRFRVNTERHSAGGNAVLVNDVVFTIVIP